MISEKRDRPLSFGQKIGLRVHLAMCALCRGYQKNLDMLSRIAARAGDAIMSQFSWGEGDEDLVLSAASKERMKEELKKADSQE
jgi:hypothetical protein